MTGLEERTVGIAAALALAAPDPPRRVGRRPIDASALVTAAIARARWRLASRAAIATLEPHRRLLVTVPHWNTLLRWLASDGSTFTTGMLAGVLGVSARPAAGVDAGLVGTTELVFVQSGTNRWAGNRGHRVVPEERRRRWSFEVVHGLETGLVLGLGSVRGQALEASAPWHRLLFRPACGWNGRWHFDDTVDSHGPHSVVNEVLVKLVAHNLTLLEPVATVPGDWLLELERAVERRRDGPLVPTAKVLGPVELVWTGEADDDAVVHWRRRHERLLESLRALEREAALPGVDVGRLRRSIRSALNADLQPLDDVADTG